jgi:predicted metal-dependent hydrolase
MDEKAKFEDGCRLFDGGEYFEAHEAWEDLWNLAQGARNAYLQGLIQVAAGLVHARRGNWNGLRKLFSSALNYLEKGKGAEEPGEVDPEALKEAMVEFELALREKLAGSDRELPYFELPRLKSP